MPIMITKVYFHRAGPSSQKQCQARKELLFTTRGNCKKKPLTGMPARFAHRWNRPWYTRGTISGEGAVTRLEDHKRGSVQKLRQVYGKPSRRGTAR